MQHKDSNIRKQIMTLLAHEVAIPYFRLTRRKYQFPYSLKQLQHFPEGTVGKELFYFFSNNDLHLLPFYEKHDIKHVVLGYPPNEEGEVCLQTFMLANGRLTLPVIFSVMVGFLIMPEKWTVFAQAWKRGRNTPSLKKLDWFGLIPQQLNIVSTKIFKK